MCDPVGVEIHLDGCLNVMAVLDMLDRELSAFRVEHVIEDTRPGFGHMQVCHPASVDGFFEPAVALGQQVRGQGERQKMYPELNSGEFSSELVKQSIFSG